jgi:hypothetical protein
MACAASFLVGNGCLDQGHDAELYAAMIAIANGQLDKAGLAAIFRRQFPKT